MAMIVNGRGSVGIRRSTVVNPSIVTNGLQLYLDAGNPLSYPGTGTLWSDISGNGKNGTLINSGSGLNFNSANGGSIQFDGINDYVGFNSLTPYGGTNPHTYSAWIYSTAFAGAIYRWIISNGNSNNGTALITKDGKVGFFYYGGDSYVTSSGVLNLNTWSYITVTYNGAGSVRFYINGTLNSTSSISGGWSAVNTTPRLGTWINGSHPFVGNMSNVQIYNRDLSASEVLQNYNALKSRFGL